MSFYGKMKKLSIEDQVCTVEQAKRLVELGATANSFTCWIQDTMNPHWNNGYALGKLNYEAMQLLKRCEVPTPKKARPKRGMKPEPEASNEIWPAYTVAELMSLLVQGDYYATFFAYDKWWFLDLRNESPYRVSQDEKAERGFPTEAQARAAMAIEILQFGTLEHCRVGAPIRYGIHREDRGEVQP